MDFSHYSDDTVEMAVDLINTVDRVSGEDELAEVAALTAFLHRFDVVTDEWTVGALTDADLRQVLAVRDRLREVFDASTEDAAAAALNSLLVDAGASPRISLHGDSPHLHFESRDGDLAQWLAATAAMSLTTVLCDYGFERFGVCNASDCVDAFIDTSKNRSRRNCSTTCTTRENVAAHRRRARETAAG